MYKNNSVPLLVDNQPRMSGLSSSPSSPTLHEHTRAHIHTHVQTCKPTLPLKLPGASPPVLQDRPRYLEVPAHSLETRSPLNWDSFLVPLMMHVAGLGTFKVLFWDLVTRKERELEAPQGFSGPSPGVGFRKQTPPPIMGVYTGRGHN